MWFLLGFGVGYPTCMMVVFIVLSWIEGGEAMTDVERVWQLVALRLYAEDASEVRDIIDAHLKEDAERERRADEFASIIQDKLMAQAAELAELRERLASATSEAKEEKP